ncbi:AarF/UbiB family protein [Bdellovibrio sp.]|uniref:AarF/UbiB family protein n=1 Tax=Bdellovibrio sp. TaxID=28201 RepID=UPI0039E4C201
MAQSENPIRLKKLREFLGYSQRDLANEFQVTSGAIAHWESGARPIPGPVVRLIDIYEESLSLRAASESIITEEALQVSRDFFRSLVETLNDEHLILEEDTKKHLNSFIESFFGDAFAKDRVRGKVKLAVARQILKSFEGSRGLSIKVAQMASFLEMGLPPEIPTLLGDIQSKGKPLSFPQIQEILKESYGRPLAKIFAKINPEPMVVTSLAQVHRATLLGGEEVVIKVKHPGISQILDGQFKKLSIISFLGGLLGKQSEDILQEIQNQVLLEVDYEREVYNQERFRNIFEHEPRIVIPKTYRELCNKNVIVSQFESGLPFATFCARATAQEKSQAGLLIAYFHSYAIFRRGLLHGDAHPGNFLFRENQVVFLDFGRIIEYESDELEKERFLYLAILNKRKAQVFSEFKKRSLIQDPESFNFEEFWRLLQKQQEHHLVETPFRITRSFLRSMNMENRNFKDRKKLRFDKSLLRSFLVNASLWSLLADLEAEAPWRKQALAMLEGQDTVQ